MHDNYIRYGMTEENKETLEAANLLGVRVRVILRVILEVLEVKYLQIRCFEIFILIFRRKMDDDTHKRLNKKMRYLVDDIKKRIMRIV